MEGQPRELGLGHLGAAFTWEPPLAAVQGPSTPVS